MSRTLGTTVFDVIFGLVWPPLCFLLDPGVMFGGGLGLGLPTWAPLAVWAMAGATMAALLAWLVLGGRHRTLDAALGGILFAGSAVAFVVGVGIFPFALMGAVVLIGLMGFVPFVTAFVCFRAARQAVGRAAGDRILTAAAALLVLIAAGGYQVTADHAIDVLVADVVRARDPAAADRALQRLESLRPLLPRREIARRGQALLSRQDWRGNEYATAFRKLTGAEMWQARGAD
jgi:hypothetical protein